MEEDLSAPDVVFKVIIVGDSAVGKTCILNRYTHDSFQPTAPTVGIGYGSKSLNVGKVTIKMQIWDTAGQESFRSIARTFYKGTHGVLLVYSIRSGTSFSNLESWVKEVREGTDEGVPIVLLGNMCDLADQRVVGDSDAQAFSNVQALDGFFESSAATGHNVQEVSGMQAFLQLAKSMHERTRKPKGAVKRQPQSGIVIDASARRAATEQKKAGKGCCGGK